MLVVIAIIGILAALLLSVLTSAKRQAARAQCLNNLRQVSAAMMMYVDGNGGNFPGATSLRIYGFQPEDWIYWRTNTALYPAFEKGPIAVLLGGGNISNLFRCSLDKNNADRLSQSRDDNGPYLYSYSFTGYGLDQAKVNHGMSSVITGTGNNRKAYLFKQSSVRNPSLKIMFAEEPGSASDNPAGRTNVIRSGRWIPVSYPLTIRHSGKADTAFADGHAQAVDWQFGQDPAHYDPAL